VRVISPGRLEDELFGWIERLARAADEQLDALLAGPDVIGHYDYRVEHLRLARRRRSAPSDGYLAALATYGGALLGVRPSPGRAG
jgi:hypothetical protein